MHAGPLETRGTEEETTASPPTIPAVEGSSQLPVVEVSLSGTYQFPTFDRLIEQLTPLFTIREPSQIWVDLRRLSFVGPTAIATILAALRRLELGGFYQEGGVWLPSSGLTARYLLRMDLFRRLETFPNPPEQFNRRQPVVFRPLSNFSDEEERSLLVFNLLNALQASCAVDSAAVSSTFAFLTELTENVRDHARTELGGFAAAQALRKKPLFEIGIVDLGVGILRSLSSASHLPTPRDDLEAILKALERGVSATWPHNSGEGLYVTAEALRANGGELLIRSGTGSVLLGARERAFTTSVRFPGTIVALRARRDRPLDYHAVYRRIDSLSAA